MPAELWELVGEICDSLEEALDFGFEEEMGQRNAQQTDGETNQSVGMQTESQESTLALHENPRPNAEHPLSHSVRPDFRALRPTRL